MASLALLVNDLSESSTTMYMRRPLLILWFAALTVLFGRFAFAQPPRGPLVVSPQVHADKTVTFRYLAPSAREVLLNGGQFGSSAVPMTKDTAGIWSVTVGPVKPDIYPYSFGVDGVTAMDPANVAFFPNERFKASLVDVPGDAPLVHAPKEVPHGTVTYEYYPSHPDKFACVCSYAPYTATDEFKGNFTNWSPNADQLNKQLKLFTISVGTEDFLYEAVKGNIAMFGEKKLAVKSYIVPGGHTWMNCKQYLATTLQELFQ
jgi:hypothetical protein